jgi:ATP-grasp domain-containing protein/L-aminoacid ligase-like protein
LAIGLANVFGNRQPIDNRQSAIDNRQSTIDNRQSAIGNRQSNRQSAIRQSQSAIDSRKSAIAMSRILLLSTTTGYQLRSFDDAAAKLGVELIFGTDRCHRLDDPWQDRAIAVRFHDDEQSMRAIEEFARERRFDGVVAVGDRPPVLAARVAERLGLRGNPPEAAAASASKFETRTRLSAAGLRAPWFRRVPLPDHGRIALDDFRVQFPCVVKPIGLSGSRGVIRADTPSQLDYAIGRVRALLARKDVRALRTGLEDALMIEAYIDGRELAIEGVLTRGELQVFAIFDKPDPLDGPFFEETIYVTPSALPSEVQHDIGHEVQRAAAALGLVHGPVHAECRLTPAGPVMLEVAARPIGGLCARVLRFVPPTALTGPADGDEHSLEELLLRHTIGENVTAYLREPAAAGVMMIPIPKRGIFRRVSGEEAARAVDFVEDVRITAKADQLIEPLPEGGSYLGFIFARAPRPRQAEAALRAAHRELRFTIDSAIDVIADAPSQWE